MTRKNFTFGLSRATLVALCVGLIMVGCGTQTPPPLPPPPPQNPNPALGGMIGNCGVAGGVQPLRPDNSPYVATLMNPRSQSQSNSIQLNLAFAQQVPADMRLRNIVGGAQVTLPDLGQIIGGGNIPSYSFCAASSMPGSSTPSFGTFDQRTGAVSLSMYGQAQVPTYTPFSPMNGGSFPGMPTVAPQFAQIPVQVNIGTGQGCGAALMDGRLYGCVMVILGIGQQALPLRYDANSGLGGGTGGFGGGSMYPSQYPYPF